MPPGSRVAVVCFGHAYGGLEMTAVHIADVLRSRSAETVLIAPDGSPPAEEAKRRAIHVEHLAPRIKYGDVVAARSLAAYFRAHQTTIAILMRSQDIHLAVIAQKFYPPVQLTFYQQMQSGIDKRDLLHRWTYSHLSLWLTLTERMRTDVLRYTTMPFGRVAVAPLGRDTRFFDPSKFLAPEARRAFDLPPDRLIVGMLGRIDPQKGQQDLLNAVPVILRAHPKALFVIAGEETRSETGYAEVLRQMASDLGIEAAVRFLPPTTDVARFLAALDVFVMPSHAETYGLVLIEAMAMQLPIVSTDAGGVPEIARPGKEALLVLPQSPGHLANAVSQLLGDKSLRVRLGSAARERAVEAFDSSRCLDILVRELSTLRKR
jgi:glycosyltransferase involved in cell wall biosynthesis